MYILHQDTWGQRGHWQGLQNATCGEVDALIFEITMDHITKT